MKFVALFTGAGDGCDYTIGCNKRFEVFEVPTHKAAVKYCKQVWEDHGGSRGEPRIEEIELFVVTDSVTVPVGEWNDDDEAKSARREAEEALREAEATAKELREKLAGRPKPSEEARSAVEGQPLYQNQPMSDELRDWLAKCDKLAAMAAEDKAKAQQKADTERASPKEPSLQGWAIQTIKDAANGQTFISKSEVVKALSSSPGYVFPEDVTVHGVVDTLVKQEFLKPCHRGFKICP